MTCTSNKPRTPRNTSNIYFYTIAAIIGILTAILPLYSQQDLANTKTTVGTVTEVFDGDTVRISIDPTTEFTGRLIYIDAPELTQSFGSKCQQILSDHVLGQSIRFRSLNIDRYGRRLIELFTINYTMVNSLLITDGCAWIHSYPTGKKAEWKALLRTARGAHSNLWSESTPCHPRYFRAHNGCPE